MLLFKKKFLPAIREGTKTQTIRLWKYARMRPGQRSYIPGVGYIRVTAVDPVRLDDLTDEDAAPDGFATADALREEITQLYPEQLAEGHQAFRIVFYVLPPEEQKKDKAASSKSEPRP
ncbi:MAG TPA: ASCH domain-containing protein [Thermoguttaceae bacterium]|nr:ASCH domain-containing protein [Thermoguttaceae bacterium]